LDDLRWKRGRFYSNEGRVSSKDCIQDEEKMSFEPHWMGGFHFAMIGRGMDRWIFSSSSLVLGANEIVDWWRLNKEGFHFILIGQGEETFTFWRRKAP
jgi:hypothetical protein